MLINIIIFLIKEKLANIRSPPYCVMVIKYVNLEFTASLGEVGPKRVKIKCRYGKSGGVLLTF